MSDFEGRRNQWMLDANHSLSWLSGRQSGYYDECHLTFITDLQLKYLHLNPPNEFLPRRQ
jgi:hypothetical protein